MPAYRRVGDVPPKRHTRHHHEGGLLFEELLGEEGFSSDSSLLYHRRVPAAVSGVRAGPDLDDEVGAHHPLRPRHLRLPALFESGPGSDLVLGRRLLLANADVRLSYVEAGAASPLTRNAIGDELVFVHEGAARLETALGVLDAGAGDYVVVPRALVHRWVPSGAGPVHAFVIEASSHIGPPARYLSARGQFLEHAPYCERDLRAPAEPWLEDGTDVDVVVRHRSHDGRLRSTIVTMTDHPFDVVGWDGCSYPYALSIHDFEPITGRIHQPPPVHQVFEGSGFVVCNFVPRKVDYHPDAIPVPYYHSNVDSDEVLFYCGGDYAARRGSGVGLGSLTLHPGGLPHGPNPIAYAQSAGIERFEETAVMVDTFRPLGLGTAAHLADDPEYVTSWIRVAALEDGPDVNRAGVVGGGTAHSGG